jgi:murein L,D-transpeptidase YcbB/YkuD
MNFAQGYFLDCAADCKGHGTREQYVSLKQTIPVFIGYFTSWVDREGKLNFGGDIYGHDKKMAAHAFRDK